MTNRFQPEEVLVVIALVACGTLLLLGHDGAIKGMFLVAAGSLAGSLRSKRIRAKRKHKKRE